MSDMVLLEFAGQPLALSREAFEEGLARGREMVGVPAAPSKDAVADLLTAEQLAERTGIPAPWYLEAARQGRISHYQIGRYRRFSLAEVAENSRFKERVNDLLWPSEADSLSIS